MLLLGGALHPRLRAASGMRFTVACQRMTTAKDSKGSWPRSIYDLSASLAEPPYTTVERHNYPEKRKKSRRLIYVLLGIALFVFIIIPAALLTGLWITERQKRAEEPLRVKVPNVVGRDYGSGQAVLEEKGLKMQINATRWDKNQPVGIIIDQSPLAGESVEVGHSVGVSVGGKPGQQFSLPQR
jgi:hypothetical protein